MLLFKIVCYFKCENNINIREESKEHNYLKSEEQLLILLKGKLKIVKPNGTFTCRIKK